MIEIRAGTDADRAGILQLLEAVFGAGHADQVQARWDWQWLQDPRLDQPGYRGAVAVWGRKIVGSVGFMPAALHAHGVPMPSVWGIDASVHSGWLRQALREERAQRAAATARRGRRGSVAGDLLNHPSAGPTVLGKLVSDQMRVVLLKIGFREFTGSGYMARNLALTPRIARLTGGWVAPLLGGLPDLVVGHLPRQPAGVHVHEGDFDAGFDALWENAARDYPCVGLRTAAVLNWRYRRHPLRSYTTVVDRKGGELRGYAVVTTFEKRRCLRGRIVDLFTRPGEGERIHGLLVGAMRVLRGLGADRVDCYLAGDALRPALRSLGFSPRPVVEPLLVRGWSAENPLYVTAGDGDGG